MNELSNFISVYNAILNYIHQRGFEDYDDFAWKLTQKTFKEFAQDNYDVERIISKFSTRFFKLNDLKRRDFFCENFAKLIIKKWKEQKRKRVLIYPSNKLIVNRITNIQKQRNLFNQISIEEIDSFKEARKISANLITEKLPLKIDEDQIKKWFADIIDEPFTQKDWGGEPNDLYSNRLKIKGKRIPTAFLLKGPGTKGPLTAAKCGKNGDQILRLIKAYSARLFIVQFVGIIHSNLIDTLEAHVAYESSKGKKLSYCVVDGVDTARILKAYNKI